VIGPKQKTTLRALSDQKTSDVIRPQKGNQAGLAFILEKKSPIKAQGAETHPMGLPCPIPGSAMLRKLLDAASASRKISQQLNRFWSLALPKLFENEDDDEYEDD